MPLVKPRIEEEDELVINKYLGEVLGTMILVGLGTMGIVSMGGAGGPAEIIGIALGFGLALFAGIWVVGHVTGAHFNPAVTLAALLDKRIVLSDAIGYWVGQFVGATLGSLIVLAATGSRAAVAGTATGYEELGTAIVSEILLTAVFVWTILAVTRLGEREAPLTIALVLTGVHVVGIPFSGASVNPARSFGPVVVGGEIGSTLLVYLWAPLVGAVIAWGLYRLFPTEEGV